jgi:hypothetical protein
MTTQPTVDPTRTLIRTDEGVVEIDLSHPHGARVVFPDTLALETVSELCAPLVVDFAAGIATMGSRFVVVPVRSAVT